MKHTPGPWYPEFDVKEHEWLINDLPPNDIDRSSIALVYRNGIGEEEANARLIAAAPELLAACQAMLQTSGHSSWLHVTNGPCRCKSCAKEMARKAIARAIGD